jgi:exonuclease, DNA polymerase III, epsilon subunit family
MGLFDILFGKKEKKQINTITAPVDGELKSTVNPAIGCIPTGRIDVEKNLLDVPTSDALRKTFIAFDVETTGLSPMSDRIVELGAVLFVNGQPTETFSSLVNPGIRISSSASAVNHITNDMLRTAPTEDMIYPAFVDFLGNALHGEVVMCAHNASFDFGFLSNTLSRLGYNGKICYVDTLSLARRYIPGLDNYKQCTLENYFSLKNAASHRAISDAENCGRILVEIICHAADEIEAERKHSELTLPTKEELAVCAFIQKVISENGKDVSCLRFRRNSSNYVEATCLYSFVKFKFAKKGHYIILKKANSVYADMILEPCTASEGGTDYTRFYFSRAFDLQPFAKDIIALFAGAQKSMSEYSSYSKRAAEEVKTMLNQMKALADDEVVALLLEESQKDVVPVEIEIEPSIPRDAVTISATHSRVPLSEIKNANNWEKGFDAGFKYYEKGEAARRDSHIEEAIAFYDKARYLGYCAPALYNAYAVVYRQIKDYENEIVILEEGMIRNPQHAGGFEARRNKALKLLFSKQDTVRKVKEKEQKKAEMQAAKEVEEVNKQPRGRRILQMDDAGIIIAEFETIAAATREIGISSKSIRDAANGVQKHAGGYCWAYKG